jgi:hypothetical protein
VSSEQFTEFYYVQFDSDRKQLFPLYRDNSMLTFESASVVGALSIVEKLSVYLPVPNIQCHGNVYSTVPSLRES